MVFGKCRKHILKRPSAIPSAALQKSSKPLIMKVLWKILPRITMKSR